MYKSLISDIKSKLAEGADIDSIAADISTAINQAKDEYDAEAAEKTKREEEERLQKEAKTAAMRDILAAYENYFRVIGNEEAAASFAESAISDEMVSFMGEILGNMSVKVVKPEDRVVAERAPKASFDWLDRLFRV